MMGEEAKTDHCIIITNGNCIVAYIPQSSYLIYSGFFF
jgi:hypothetical protein